MNNKHKKTKLINVRIDVELLSSYKEYCAKYGYDVSKRIRMYIYDDISQKLEGLGDGKST
jgi:antitoxin component of RelBE/YafQ-DinJ toxin-antitoxin module